MASPLPFSASFCLCSISRSPAPRTKARIVRILLLYALVIDVGVMGFLFGFIPHVCIPKLGRLAKVVQLEISVMDGPGPTGAPTGYVDKLAVAAIAKLERGAR